MGLRVQMSLTRAVPCLWLPDSCDYLDLQATLTLYLDPPYGYDLVSSESCKGMRAVDWLGHCNQVLFFLGSVCRFSTGSNTL